MTEDGRFDMMDIIGMLAGGDLDLTPPKSAGRIVTGFNGLILGLESKHGILEDRMVYTIQSKGDVLTLVKKGKSNIDFNSENRDISQIILMERQRLIMTERERYSAEVAEEIEEKGFFETRDRYLVEADDGVLNAQSKLDVISMLYPISKHPEKWV